MVNREWGVGIGRTELTSLKNRLRFGVVKHVLRQEMVFTKWVSFLDLHFAC